MIFFRRKYLQNHNVCTLEPIFCTFSAVFFSPEIRIPHNFDANFKETRKKFRQIDPSRKPEFCFRFQREEAGRVQPAANSVQRTQDQVEELEILVQEGATV
jgi:hypothetical protein